VSALIESLKASRFLRFLVVGGFGFFVAEGALWLVLHTTNAGSTIAWFISFLCAATFTWWGNRNLTFADRKAHGAAGMLAEYGKFLASNGLGGAINFAVFKGLEIYAPAPLNNPFLALACGVLAGLVFNFTASRLVVFRN
jgi:putative flippase GtrA